jgi:SAM-dependent methyltransferase
MVWDDIWHQKRYVSDYTLRFYAYLDSLAQSLHRDAAILECGCGPGGGLTRFAMNGLCAYGIDLSTTAVMNARAQGSNVVRANILAMPFPSGSFDLVYNSGVIEHFDKPEIALAEMARVTKPGGKVLVIVPNKFCPQYQLYKFITMKLGTWPFGYEESYSLGRLKRLYANANLTIDRVVAFQVLPPLATHDWELLPLSIRRRLMGLERLFPFRVYYAYAIGILGAKRQKASQSCNVGA